MTVHAEVKTATPPDDDDCVAGPVTVTIVPFVAQAGHFVATLQPLEVPSATSEPEAQRRHPR